MGDRGGKRAALCDQNQPTQDFRCELWEKAESSDLDTWYILKGMDSVRNSDHLLGAGPDADEGEAGSR